MVGRFNTGRVRYIKPYIGSDGDTRSARQACLEGLAVVASHCKFIWASGAGWGRLVVKVANHA